MTSVSSGGHSVERAEDTALRAKNEVLERQLAITKEQLEETKLELNASRKVRVYYYVLCLLRVYRHWSLCRIAAVKYDCFSC